MAGALFRYYRFIPVATRTASADCGQLSEVAFRSGGTIVDMAAAAASNPGGSSSPSEGPAKAIDGNANTRWCDVNKGNLIVEFGTPTHADQFSFTTGSTNAERDPVSWRIDGSVDAVSWITLQDVADFGTPTSRGTQIEWLPLLQAVPNNGFELGSSVNEYNGTIPSWTGTGKVLLIRSGNPSWGSTAAEEGRYFLGLVGAESAISQTVPHHIPGMAYTLRFMAARRQGYPDPILEILVGGDVVKSFVPASATFSATEVHYVAPAGEVTIGFRNGGPRGDRTAFIDHVVIVEEVLMNATPETTSTSTSTTLGTDSAATGVRVQVTTSSTSDAWWMVIGAWCGVVIIGAVVGLACCARKAWATGRCCSCWAASEKGKVVAFDDW